MAPQERSQGVMASRWHHLLGPTRVLVWLLIALSVVNLYHGAEFLVVHVFSVLLLFIFAAVVALVLTPVVDRMQRVPPFSWHRPATVLALYLGVLGAVYWVTTFGSAY